MKRMSPVEDAALLETQPYLPEFPCPRRASRQTRRVEIIAHRGASYDAPENTLAAARLAWAQGADALELDLHLTRDGRLAVIHDNDLQRVAGDPRLVAAATR
jgi:glycerophosphoryl diester phosphodiesterase